MHALYPWKAFSRISLPRQSKTTSWDAKFSFVESTELKQWSNAKDLLTCFLKWIVNPQPSTCVQFKKHQIEHIEFYENVAMWIILKKITRVGQFQLFTTSECPEYRLHLINEKLNCLVNNCKHFWMFDLPFYFVQGVRLPKHCLIFFHIHNT